MPHKNFREGQFLWGICWRLKYKIENIKIETDQKILYNGINLAWSRAMLFCILMMGFT